MLQNNVFLDVDGKRYFVILYENMSCNCYVSYEPTKIIFFTLDQISQLVALIMCVGGEREHNLDFVEKGV